MLPSNQTWKEVFVELAPRRCLWGEKRDTERKENKIMVCARMKPRSARIPRKPTAETEKVTLPLHQRLSLIRMSKNLKSNRDALQILHAQGGWFAEKWKQERAANQFTAEETPTAEKDLVPGLSSGIHAIDPKNDRLFVVDPIKGLREFAFDHVLPDPSSQDETYEHCARKLVFEFINGSNATCLAYGQTGSGKTYTMFGPHDPHQARMSFDRFSTKWGIVPRAIHEVFEAINYRKKNLNLHIESDISISYVEIYGDKVSDLLRKRAPCGHSRAAAQRYVLEGAAERKVGSFDDAMELLNEGETEKRIASTAMNERSSRAHTLLILTLRQSEVETKKTKESKLFLVDLGGSESLKKSRANGNRERTKEAININLGLLALKKCTEALSSNTKSRKKYVPYADSKLTMLLSTGLGGNSKSCVVICGDQDPCHAKETLNTIAFGRAISTVSNTCKVGDEEAMLQHLLAEVDRGIAQCEEKIRLNERWVTKEESRHDVYGEMEIRKTTVLEGAESYRLELETLLLRRAQLAGTTIDTDAGSRIVGFGNAHQYGMGHKYNSGNE